MRLRQRVASLSFALHGDTISSVRRFWPYRRNVLRQWWQTATIDLIDPLISVALLWSTKALIDEVFVGGRFDQLGAFVVIYFSIAVVKFVLNYAQARLDASAAEQIALDVKGDLYRHILSLSPGSLRTTANGDLLTRLSGDAGHVEYLIYSGALGVLNNVFKVIIFGSALFILNWQLTACALVIGPLIAFVSIRTSPLIRRASRVARRATGAWMSFAEERLRAIPIVHAFSTHDREVAAFVRTCAKARDAEVRVVKIQALIGLVIEIVAALGSLVVMAVGAIEMQRGDLTLGTFVAFLGSVGSLLRPLRGLAKTPGRFQRAAVRAQRISEIFDTKSLVTDRATARPLRNVKGKLEFRNVRFGYRPGQLVLHDVSLRLEPDETVAIVGPSGSGKSTLVNLALRFYDVTGGSVLIDDTDVRDVTLDSLRRAVTAVFQEPYLSRGSIADNICYGTEQHSEPKLRAAASATQLSTLVSALPAGFDTSVGSHGTWLSGGQRQRIALARAVFRDSRILILDEATAALDSETEELMRDAMSRLMGRRTMLVIGHRLSTVRSADRVVVLDNGRIVEMGTPSALLRVGTRFHELFAAQANVARIPA